MSLCFLHRTEKPANLKSNKRKMNLVHLIGTIYSEPQLHELPNGRRLMKFTLVTEESYLDLKGQNKHRKNWHNLSAWGRWVQVLKEYGALGTSVAIEGRIVSHFFHQNGKKQMKSEIEINDLIIL